MISEAIVVTATAQQMSPDLLRFMQQFKSLMDVPTGTGYRHDASGTPISVGYSHGEGGNFRLPGVQPDMFHTIVGNQGILGLLPTRSTVESDPTYAIVTGVTDGSGDEQDGLCDNAPVAGLIKNCVTAAPFGRYSRATQEIELTRIGKTADRADPMDLQMVGSPISQSGLFATGPGDPTVPANVFRNETDRKFFEMGVALHRLISQQLWRGSTVNNSAGGGYKEINGFDRLINTGYQDVLNQTSCPSVDSILHDYLYGDVSATGSDLVNILTYLYRYVADLARRTGVNPVRWVFAMREELFYEITQIWPCAYLTYRCESLGDNDRLNVNGDEQRRMSDDMRNGRYLLIDGVKIPVVLDDGISAGTPTTDANVREGCSASDIYLIPMSVSGGRAVTFLEHMDFGNSSLASALGAEGGLINAQVEGPWLTIARQTNTCVQWQTHIEPRLVMRTPWLAARLQNVMYCPTINVRNSFPDDPYFINGGSTSRSGPSFYDIWAA